MVLTQGLVDRDGNRWPMAGLLPGVAQMSNKLAALGYRHATAVQSNLLADANETLRGHEFHYSQWLCDEAVSGDSTAWRIRGSRGPATPQPAGFSRGNLLASYLHIHFGQDPAIARRFVQRLSQSIHFPVLEPLS
jgi:cobyrinic acid a,c-diamide synthase